MNQISADDLKLIESQKLVGRVEYHRELESTNDLAMQLARSHDVVLPLLVLTENQTRGRGRGENQWWSSTGALTFSLVVSASDLVNRTSEWPRISLTVGLGICDALNRLFPKANLGIKWPNDVFWGEQKVAGILIETPTANPDRLIIGCGVNVNNSFSTAPVELQATATSLFDQAQEYSSLSQVLIEILEAFSNDFERLKTDPDSVIERLRTASVLTGRTVRITAGTDSMLGVCQGIDARGALLIEDETGRRAFHAGSIEICD